MFNVGDFVEYKTKAGRGRPAKGYIRKNRGIGFTVQGTKDKTERFVPKAAVLRVTAEYVKPEDRVVNAG